MPSVSRRFPPWLRKRIPPEGETARVRELLRRLRLHTVCESAHCPNLFECFARGTATFMILGDTCTRHCRFCAVASGEPAPPDPEEPGHVAEAVAELGLSHVVVTSVTRDDLPDGGSGQFAATIGAVREASEATVEVLTPDFQGRWGDLDRVLEAGPDVFNHNVETVPRLYPEVRPEADYDRSLAVLRRAGERAGGLLTKSGLMVGLGERPEEVLGVLRDLRGAGCGALTMGQYLSPSAEHAPVGEFVTPEQFDTYKAEAEAMGFSAVAAAPFVRSSYQAGALYAGLTCARRS
ncbi:MAG: lipoyl synthase [bacterium]